MNVAQLKAAAAKERHIKQGSYTAKNGTISMNVVNGDGTDQTEKVTITDVASKAQQDTNTGNIGINTSNIKTNTNNISQNTQSIKANTDDITGLGARMDTNEANITDLNGRAVMYDKKEDGTVNKSILSLGWKEGDKQNDTKIQNVADGTEGHDAVNFSQLTSQIKGVRDEEDYVTGGTISGGNIVLNRFKGGAVTISGLDTYVDGLDSYVTGASLDGNTLKLKLNNEKKEVTVDLGSLAGGGGTSSSDYRLVANPETDSKGEYTAKDGTLKLTVQDSLDAANIQTITITDVASKAQQDTNTKSIKANTDNITALGIQADANKASITDLNDRAVMYEKNNDGAVDKNFVTFKGTAYMAETKSGGTMLKNVAYATNVKAGSPGYDGSAAVNVDRLNDSIRDAIKDAGGTGSDTRLVQGKGNGDKNKEYGQVTSNGDVNLRVEDSAGTGYDVTITDVASKTDLDKVKTDLGDVNKKVTDINDKVSNLGGRVDKIEESIKDTVSKNSATVSNGNGIKIEEGENENGAKDYKVSLEPDFTLGDEKESHVSMEGTKGNIIATGKVAAGNISISNNAVKVGDKTYISDKGLNANGQKVTNVEDGDIKADSKDAVNGRQLYRVQVGMENNAANISQVANKVNRLNVRVNKAAAGAAALAALNPVDYDPEDKLSFAMGYGHYSGEGAAAIGAYYQPNENTIINFGSSMGNGEELWNAGVSFKLGHGNTTTSRAALAKKVSVLEKQNADLNAQNGELVKRVDRLSIQVEALLSLLDETKKKDFPDVPADHWAYEAVSKLGGNGVVQGDPDGTFHGDRTMSRYELAQIVYNTLKKGQKAEAELIEEFRPELEQIAAEDKR